MTSSSGQGAVAFAGTNVEALRADLKLALQERDAAQMLFAQTQDELDAVVRRFQEVKVERDRALGLQGTNNNFRASEHVDAMNRMNIHYTNSADSDQPYGPPSSERMMPSSAAPTTTTSGVSGGRFKAQQVLTVADNSDSRQHQRHLANEQSEVDESGDKVVYETHTVVIPRVPNYGFGIAVSGGRDNPHYTDGDPAIVVSDVLKRGPASEKLFNGDRILSVNGISMDNIDHATAISVLKDSGQCATLVIRRKVTISSTGDFEQPFKLTLAKKNKKDDYGVVLGCKLYVKEIIPNSLAAQNGNLKQGDAILKVNGTPVDTLSLADAKKLIDKTKEKLQLVVARSGGHRVRPSSSQPSSHNNNNNNSNNNTATGEAVNSAPAAVDGKPVAEPAAVPANTRADTGPIPARSVTSSNGSVARPRDQSATDGLPAAPVHQQPPPPTGPASVDQQHRPYGPVPDHPAGPMSSSGIYGYVGYPTSESDNNARRIRSEPRYVSFRKEGGVGIRIAGGNRTGIFVAKVAPHTPAEVRGLREGDMILKVNDVDMLGKTREEAVLLLLGLRDHVSLLVQHRRPEYDKLMEEGGTGDLFYIRTHFTYAVTEHREMSFKRGDIFLITDTLFSGVVGSWQAQRIVRQQSHEAKKGIIPNLSRAEQIMLTQHVDKDDTKDDVNKSPCGGESNGGGGFFRRLSAPRSKSLGKDQWDGAFFGHEQTPSNKKQGQKTAKYSAYERVVLRETGFKRPVVIYGPLADVARDKLVAELPEKFEAPRLEIGTNGDRSNKTGIIKLSNIREIIEKNRHCVLDVNPSAVDRLIFAQFAPIVVFLRAESKHAVKDLRQHWTRQPSKSYRKLFEQSTRLEKLYSYQFTFTIPLTNGTSWYKKMKEAVDKSQMERVWMSEVKPEINRDDVLFPLMGNRLSFTSSPESENDLTGAHTAPSKRGAPPSSSQKWNRAVRASSDPSIATLDNRVPPAMAAPGLSSAVSGSRLAFYDGQDPDYQAAGIPVNAGPKSGYPRRGYPDDDREVQRGPVADYQTNAMPSMSSRPPQSVHDPFYRMAIDPYVTLTPSERMKFRQMDPGRRLYESHSEYPSSPSVAYASSRISSDSPQIPRGYHPDRYSGRPSQPLPPPPGGDGWTYSTYGSDDRRQFGERKMYAGDSYHRGVPNKPENPRPYERMPPPSHPPPPRPVDPAYSRHANGDLQYEPPGQSRPSSGRGVEPSMTPNGSRRQYGPQGDAVDYLFQRQANADNVASRQATAYQHPPANEVDRDTDTWRSHQSRATDNRPAKPPHVLDPRLERTEVSQTAATVPSRINSSESPQENLSTNQRLPPGNGQREYRTSAFESYRKPSGLSGGPSEQDLTSASQLPPSGPVHNRGYSVDSEGHPVVATERGIFDSNGGILESKETGVSIVIPVGAIPEGIQQEIYFKVCHDNSIMPPLDKEKGETLLSPLVMCGPHGLQFLKPVELRLPHCAAVNPDSWSFALKSSDSPSGHPSHWQNVSLASAEGVAQGHVGKSSVSVHVDHF